MKYCLRKLQAQLDAILKYLSLNSPNNTGPTYKGGNAVSHPRKARFQADGKPIFMHCRGVGHIARFCRTELSGGYMGVRGEHAAGQGQSPQVSSHHAVNDSPTQHGN